jgi:phosphatidate cytidylyltransferase
VTQGAQWADLRMRMLSAAVLISVGALEIWLGGVTFALLVVALTGAMVWELATMTAPARRNTPMLMAAIAVVALGITIAFPARFSTAFLLAPALALALTPRRDRRLTTLYAVAIMVAGYGLINLRGAGSQTIIWLVLVVVVTDVLGYFAGRML